MFPDEKALQNTAYFEVRQTQDLKTEWKPGRLYRQQEKIVGFFWIVMKGCMKKDTQLLEAGE